MKEQLISLRGKPVSVFALMPSGAESVFHGPLRGGELPGQPWGVQIGQGYAQITASIGFTPEQVKSIDIRSHQNIITLL